MKRRLVLSFIALVGVLVVANHSTRSRQPEPSYQGRTLGDWLDGLENNPHPEDGPEEKAIRAIGTNSFPILVRWLGEHDSALKAWWIDRENQMEWLPFHPTFRRSHSEYATSAFQVLGTKGAPVVPTLLPLLKHRDARVRADVALCLGEIETGAKAAVPDLSRALTDEDENVRGEAAWALGQIHENPEEVVPLLLRVLPDNTPDVQAEMVSAIGQFGSDAESAVGTLQRILDGDKVRKAMDDQVRAAAAYALGEIGEEASTVVPILLTTMQDPDADVRRQSIQALGLFGEAAQEAVPLLIKLLPESADDAGEPDEEALAELRGAAAESLGEIQYAPLQVIPALIASLTDSDNNARMLKVEALGKFGPEARAALTALKSLIQDEDAEVRAAATNALLEIDPSILPAASKRVGSNE